MDRVSKKVRARMKLDYEPETFFLVGDHFILRFQAERDCALVRNAGTWLIVGQLLTIEPWEPNSAPSHRAVHKTVVWLRLPELLLEYWKPTTISMIAAEVGKPVSMHDFVDCLRKTGYTRVKIELDAIEPLKPGNLIRYKKEAFW